MENTKPPIFGYEGFPLEELVRIPSTHHWVLPSSVESVVARHRLTTSNGVTEIPDRVVISLRNGSSFSIECNDAKDSDKVADAIGSYLRDSVQATNKERQNFLRSIAAIAGFKEV